MKEGLARRTINKFAEVGQNKITFRMPFREPAIDPKLPTELFSLPKESPLPGLKR